MHKILEDAVLPPAGTISERAWGRSLLGWAPAHPRGIPPEPGERALSGRLPWRPHLRDATDSTAGLESKSGARLCPVLQEEFNRRNSSKGCQSIQMLRQTLSSILVSIRGERGGHCTSHWER